MAALPPEALAAALGAVHKAGLNTDPNAPTPGSSSGGGSAPSGPADPSQDPNAQDPNAQQDPNADPNAQGADPQHQALWQLFPSTDPSWLQSLISQGGDPAQALDQYVQQRESDTGQFNQLQDAMMSHLVTMFAAPDGGGQDTGAPPPQDPGVGGAGAGY